MKLLFLIFFALTFSASSFGATKSFYGNLGLRHNDPYGKIDDVQGNKYWADLDLKYSYRRPFIDWEAKVDLSFRYNDARFLAFSINEAQITKLYNTSEVTYGVQILDWVEIDSVWGLGKINNAELFDYFNPGQAGLPGVRFKYRLSPSLEMDVFGSFLYIPQLNPMLNINARNNTITSRTPWAEVPASTVESANPNQTEDLNINYIVNIPSIPKLVTQLTGGVNFKYSPLDNLHFSGFILRKPENRIGNSAQVFLQNTDITANITPEVYYHTLFGGQIASTFKSKEFKAYLSYYTSIPAFKTSEINSTTEDLLSQSNAGLGISLEQYREDYLGIGVKYKTEKVKAELGYLARLSRFQKVSVVDAIPRWSGALNARFEARVAQTWSGMFDIKYDTITFDRLYQASISKAFGNVSASLGFEIIGTPESGKGFWVPFRENDSYFAQLNMIF